MTLLIWRRVARGTRYVETWEFLPFGTDEVFPNLTICNCIPATAGAVYLLQVLISRECICFTGRISEMLVFLFAGFVPLQLFLPRFIVYTSSALFVMHVYCPFPSSSPLLFSPVFTRHILLSTPHTPLACHLPLCTTIHPPLCAFLLTRQPLTDETAVS